LRAGLAFARVLHVKQGLVEWAVVTAVLVAVAAGVAVAFGDELRAAFGVRAAPASTSRAAAPPSP